MKSIYLMLAAAFVCASCLAQNDTEPYSKRSLVADNISSIELNTSGGNITVKGGYETTARIEVFIRSTNGGALSKKALEDRLQEYYTLTINVSNNKLEAVAKPKKQKMDWKQSLNISFVIYAARKLSAELATSGGTITLSNLSGNLDFSTSGGSLNLDSLSGNVNGKTSGGTIKLTNLKAVANLATSGGSIEASKSSGEIKLSTSGGSIKLSELDGNISAYTSGGSIKAVAIRGELKSGTSGGSVTMSDMMCSLETSTSGGQVTVAVKQLGKYLKINNSGGDINLSMPGNIGVDLDLSAKRINTDIAKNFSGRMSSTQINGPLNGGGVPVSVRAGGGRINLVIK